MCAASCGECMTGRAHTLAIEQMRRWLRLAADLQFLHPTLKRRSLQPEDLGSPFLPAHPQPDPFTVGGLQPRRRYSAQGSSTMFPITWFVEIRRWSACTFNDLARSIRIGSPNPSRRLPALTAVGGGVAVTTQFSKCECRSVNGAIPPCPPASHSMFHSSLARPSRSPRVQSPKGAGGGCPGGKAPGM